MSQKSVGVGSNAATPLLSVEHLDAGYRQKESNVRAVRDVSFDVRPGEFLGLAGESGCGKSTLALALTRLLLQPGEVFDGRVLFDGEDLVQKSEEEMRQMRWRDFSIVYQASMNVLNPVMRVRKQFVDVMRTHSRMSEKEINERTEEMFHLVNINPKYLDAYPHQLSGGMKQRVSIAMALSLRPKLVIMDEPTTALDVVVQRAILQQIDEIRQKLGFSLILITHDLSLLVEIADRIAIMYAGQIIEQAPAAELYRDPLHPYTDGLMHAFPPLVGKRQRLHGIAGHPPDLRAQLPGCPFYERCEKRIEGVCDRIPPSFEEIHPDHGTACHLYGEEGATHAG